MAVRNCCPVFIGGLWMLKLYYNSGSFVVLTLQWKLHGPWLVEVYATQRMAIRWRALRPCVLRLCTHEPVLDYNIIGGRCDGRMAGYLGPCVLRGCAHEPVLKL